MTCERGWSVRAARSGWRTRARLARLRSAKLMARTKAAKVYGRCGRSIWCGGSQWVRRQPVGMAAVRPAALSLQECALTRALADARAAAGSRWQQQELARAGCPCWSGLAVPRARAVRRSGASVRGRTARSTSSAVQKLASAFLYISQTAGCLIGKRTKRCLFSCKMGSAASAGWISWAGMVAAVCSRSARKGHVVRRRCATLAERVGRA